MSKSIKITLRAADIPDRSVVTKRTGTKEYVLRKAISVYIAGEAKQEIKGDGNIFLVSDDGTINSFDWNKELTWCTTYNRLYDFLTYRDYSDEEDEEDDE